MIRIIAAVAKNGVIGRKGELTWHLPDDLKHFRELTMGGAVIMGRTTFEGIIARIGTPLSGRTNIVITRQPGYGADGTVVVHSLEAALAAVPLGQQAWIMGGGEIYTLALPVVDRLYLTEVQAEVPGDTYFPALDMTQWQETERIHHPPDENHPFSFDFVTYARNG